MKLDWCKDTMNKKGRRKDPVHLTINIIDFKQGLINNNGQLYEVCRKVIMDRKLIAVMTGFKVIIYNVRSLAGVAVPKL